MAPIKDIISYNASMIKAMEDKLFFLNHLPEGNYTFVDFGCADGTLLNVLADTLNNDNNFYIGYDILEQMILLALQNSTIKANKVLFSDNWNNVQELLLSTTNKKVLILSSVIHEVYTYATGKWDLHEFWRKVLDSGFDYIVIRDMLPAFNIERETDAKTLSKIRNQTKLTKDKVDEFCATWGPLTSNKNLIHFLLKYRWEINWEREVQENYFPIYIDDLLKEFTIDYNLDYLERFRVPFLDKCIKEDFDIELKDFTHCKLIFSRAFVL